MGFVLQPIGRRLARYLAKPRDVDVHPATSPGELVAAALQPGDVLLVEGTSRFSAAIKYLTQSTWSHAALYVGDVIDPPGFVGERRLLIEADVNEGVRAVPFSEYAGYHTRICRAVGLTDADMGRVCDYMISRLGYQYDIRNIVDLARYLVQAPPVPAQWKRRMLAPVGPAASWIVLCGAVRARRKARGARVAPLHKRRATQSAGAHSTAPRERTGRSITALRLLAMGCAMARRRALC
mgnify:CR=1 FL=1